MCIRCLLMSHWLKTCFSLALFIILKRMQSNLLTNKKINNVLNDYDRKIHWLCHGWVKSQKNLQWQHYLKITPVILIYWFSKCAETHRSLKNNVANNYLNLSFFLPQIPLHKNSKQMDRLSCLYDEQICDKIFNW